MSGLYISISTVLEYLQRLTLPYLCCAGAERAVGDSTTARTCAGAGRQQQQGCQGEHTVGGRGRAPCLGGRRAQARREVPTLAGVLLRPKCYCCPAATV